MTDPVTDPVTEPVTEPAPVSVACATFASLLRLVNAAWALPADKRAALAPINNAAPPFLNCFMYCLL